MRRILIALTLLISVPAVAESLTEENYAQAREYIIASATDWAETMVTADVSKRKIYFAEDFQGTGIDGARYGKDRVVIERQPPTEYVSNEIGDIDVRFFGTTAIAYGEETWTKVDGATGKWVWTDIWMYRNGQWQIVAAQDVQVVK
jgi:hypothetical protein